MQHSNYALICILLVSYFTFAEGCSTIPPPFNVPRPQSVSAGSTATLATITCPSGQQGKFVYANIVSTDQSLFTAVVAGGTASMTLASSNDCAVYSNSVGGSLSFTGASTVNVRATCHNSWSDCPLQFEIGLVCNPSPATNREKCIYGYSTCNSKAFSIYWSPEGGNNVGFQSCCTDNTMPLTDEATGTCSCGLLTPAPAPSPNPGSPPAASSSPSSAPAPAPSSSSSPPATANTPNWIGSWDTSSSTCSRTQCCCLSGIVQTTAPDGSLILTGPLSGTDCPPSRTLTFSGVSSAFSQSSSSGGIDYALNLSSDSRILWVMDTGYAACSGSLQRTTATATTQASNAVENHFRNGYYYCLLFIQSLIILITILCY